MPGNPLDPLLDLPRLPVPDMVAMLRQINGGGARPRGALDPPRPDAGASGGADLLFLLPRLVLEGIARSNRDLLRLIGPAAGPAAAPADPAERRYAELRDRFDRLEAELQRHSATVDRMLARAPSAGGASPGVVAYQETVFLQCPRAGRTAGRFRCVSRRGRPTTVKASARPLARAGAPGVTVGELSVLPSAFSLDPGEAVLVQVVADLAGCPDVVDQRLEASVDMHMDDELALKVWIEVQAYG